MDAEERRAARLDKWIVWEAKEGPGVATLLYSFLLFSSHVQGSHSPSFAHSAPMRRRISPRQVVPRAVPFVLWQDSMSTPHPKPLHVSRRSRLQYTVSYPETARNKMCNDFGSNYFREYIYTLHSEDSARSSTSRVPSLIHCRTEGLNALIKCEILHASSSTCLLLSGFRQRYLLK